MASTNGRSQSSAPVARSTPTTFFWRDGDDLPRAADGGDDRRAVARAVAGPAPASDCRSRCRTRSARPCRGRRRGRSRCCRRRSARTRARCTAAPARDAGFCHSVLPVAASQAVTTPVMPIESSRPLVNTGVDFGPWLWRGRGAVHRERRRRSRIATAPVPVADVVRAHAFVVAAAREHVDAVADDDRAGVAGADFDLPLLDQRVGPGRRRRERRSPRRRGSDRATASSRSRRAARSTDERRGRDAERDGSAGANESLHMTPRQDEDVRVMV